MIGSLSLHNLLHKRSCDTYMLPGFTDEIEVGGNICNGTWRGEATSEFLCSLEATKQKPYSKNAKEIRTTFKDYFCGAGEFPWQWKVLI